MNPKLRLTLSPVALATVLALAATAQSVLPVPWFSVNAAGASHCAPACDCDAPPCDCDAPPCVCNEGCCADPDDDLD